MYKHLLPVLFLMALGFGATAQIGGINTYEFLNLAPSARVSAMGANLITIRDDDVNLAMANPSLLNPLMHQQISFSHSFHLAGIQHGYVGYGHYAERLKTSFHGGIQYVNYGEIDATDEMGNIEGQFKAAEYAINMGAAYPVNERMSIGANVKMISSQLAGYSSWGIVSDVAAIYYDTSRQFTATMVFRNMGTQLSTFDELGETEPLPFEIQLGISKRLRYLPFRFSIIYHHFNRWNVLYDDPNAEQGTIFIGDLATERSATSIYFDNLFRHFIFNGELLIGKKENFRLRFGYNHFLKSELSLENFRSLAGFTYGFGLKINRFRLDYGRTNFHLAGGVNHLTISTNIKEFKK